MPSRVVRAAGTLPWLLLALVGCEPAGYIDPEPNLQVVKQIQAGGGAAEAGGGAAEAAAATGTGWGTLRGAFVLAGPPPAPRNLATGGKDGQVCDAQPIPDQSLVVDGAGGLANVVIYARKVARVHESYAATADQEAVFDQKGCVFLTHVLPLRTSQPLRIKNSDPIGHNTNMSPPLEAGFNQSIAGGESAMYQFKRAQNEPVPATCNIHPWMKAYIIPRIDPYIAVSAADGTFEIANLPAGEEIEFFVWHERTPSGLAAKPDWAKGRFKLTIAPDEQMDLGKIEVASTLLQ